MREKPIKILDFCKISRQHRGEQYLLLLFVLFLVSSNRTNKWLTFLSNSDGFLMGRMNGTRLSLLVGEGRELTSSACLQFSIRELVTALLLVVVLTDAQGVKERVGAGDTGETGDREDVSLISSSELIDSSSSSAGVEGQLLLKARHPFSSTLSNDIGRLSASIFE